MSFTRALERNFNRNMQRDRASRAARDDISEDSNIKKHHAGPAAYANELDEEEDAEICEKKDRPPRFSTIFAGRSPVPLVLDQEPPRRRRSGGILIPLPLFILLAIFFFLETTFLFTYTIIGLYNNRPSGLLPLGSTASPLGSCNCADRQAGINIAPNFIMTQQGPAATVTVTQTTTTSVVRPNLVPIQVPPTTLTKSVTSSTTTIPAGQSAVTSIPTTSVTTTIIDPAARAESAISRIASLVHSTQSKPETTTKPTFAQSTLSTKTTSSTKSSGSLGPSDAPDLTGCLAGQGSIQCQTDKNIIPEGQEG